MAGDSLPPEIMVRVARLYRLVDWLDSRFVVPGTRFRFGIDPLLGLLPGIGDGVSAMLSCVLIYEAHRMGAPLPLRARMAVNIILDWVLGSLPVVGDVFDAYFKANRINLLLLIRYLRRQHSGG